MAIIGKVMRQHLALTTGFVEVEKRIDDFPNINRTLATRTTALGKDRRDPFPGFITNIGWIGLATGFRFHRTLMSSLCTTRRHAC